MTARTASRHSLLYFDVVRGLSAQLVLLGHSLNIFLPGVFMVPVGAMYRATGGIFYIQNLGVVLFFVLSGYLITSSVLRKLDRDPSYGLTQYALERATRILVPFVPALILVAVLDQVVFAGGRTSAFIVPDDSVRTWFANALMLYNNPGLTGVGELVGLDVLLGPYGTAAPFWTVVIEWWLYACFGLIALTVAGRARIRPYGVAFLLFALAVPVVSLTAGSGLVLAWLVGMVYALSVPAVKELDRRGHLLIATLGLGLAGVLLWTGAWNLYQPGVVLGVSIAVMSGYHAIRRREDERVGADAPQPGPSRSSALIRFVSDYSYSLYLVHYSLLIYVAALLPDLRARWAVPLVFVFANVVALGFWWAFERHYPRVRTALAARRAG